MVKPKRAEMDPQASRVIEQFGGTAKVAKLCGIKPASVSEWKRNGIPQAREQYLRLLNPAAFAER